MSKKINNEKTQKLKSEIKNAFNSFEPENNGLININQLNDCSKINNLNKKNPFLSDAINSLTLQKNEQNEELISSQEYLSFFDEQLKDLDSKEGLEKIFNIINQGSDKNFSFMKLPLIMKELGNDEAAEKLMTLIEQGKMMNKEIDFDEFCDIMNDDYDNNLKSLNESDDNEMKESYKEKKNKRKNKEESDEMGTLSSKNEDTKNSLENNEGEKTKKRYHRRYRDTKNKNENNEKDNNTNNKIHTKYRKKK